MNTSQQVFEVIQHALNKTKYSNSIQNEKHFYKTVIENGLSGLVYSVLDQTKVSSELFSRIEKSFYEYVKRDLKQLEAKSKLQEIFESNQIDFMFLKGIRLKPLYPETYMRAMGDIDILIKEKDLESVHVIFEKHHITCTARSRQHDMFEMNNGLIIEIHPRLYKEFNPKYEPLFRDAWQYAHAVTNHEYEFDPEYEILYLLYHLAKHMDASGIGLRSVLDIGIFLKHQEDQMKESVLQEYLKLSDMMTFYLSRIEINRKCFGFPFHWAFHQESHLSDDEINRVTDYLMISGIHGLGNDYNPFVSRIASYQMKKKSKFRLLMNLMFPSYESVKGMYPFTAKWKPLIVIGWMRRWFKLIFKKRKSSLHKIKQLKVDPKDIERQKDLFTKIGL
jgi:hypothetical protein